MSANEPAIRVLSEARTKIAEGEWVRGTYYTTREVAEQVAFGAMGAEMTRKVECFCVMGAINGAAVDISEQIHLSGDYAALNHLRVAVDQAVDALAATIVRPRRRKSLLRADIQVIGHNDNVLENKEQALQWFDRAIKELMG